MGSWSTGRIRPETLYSRTYEIFTRITLSRFSISLYSGTAKVLGEQVIFTKAGSCSNWQPGNFLTDTTIGNACQLLHITGGGDQPPHEDDPLESEIRRRRLWACYFMHCYSSEKLFNFDAVVDIDTLPLPWTEEDFEAGVSASLSTSLCFDQRNGGIFSHLIEGMRLW